MPPFAPSHIRNGPPTETNVILEPFRTYHAWASVYVLLTPKLGGCERNVNKHYLQAEKEEEKSKRATGRIAGKNGADHREGVGKEKKRKKKRTKPIEPQPSNAFFSVKIPHTHPRTRRFHPGPASRAGRYHIQMERRRARFVDQPRTRPHPDSQFRHHCEKKDGQERHLTSVKEKRSTATIQERKKTHRPRNPPPPRSPYPLLNPPGPPPPPNPPRSPP